MHPLFSCYSKNIVMFDRYIHNHDSCIVDDLESSFLRLSKRSMCNDIIPRISLTHYVHTYICILNIRIIVDVHA